MASKADFTIISNGATFEVESGSTNHQGVENDFNYVEVETKRDVLTSRELRWSFLTLGFKIYKNAEISGIEILDPSNTLSGDAGTGKLLLIIGLTLPQLEMTSLNFLSTF